MPKTTTPRPLNVLLIGGGGREHALARAIARSPRLGTLHVTHPANPGLASLGRAVDVPVDIKQIYRLRQYCDHNRVGLVVVGPEAPLAEGFTDQLTRTTIPSREGDQPRVILGPTKAAARLESDKAFAKKIMRDASIPTAEGRSFDDLDRARAYLESRDEPQVIKAAGLAGGKGVVLPESHAHALEALDDIMNKARFGDAGSSVIIEERLTGPELSVIALVDGRSILVLPPCQDHKRLGENDTGPNTGGMGAFCPSPLADDDLHDQIERDILVPTVDAMRTADAPFTGVLYAGLMLTHAGPKVLEFNVRFGDPECQPLMARLESDALEMFNAAATGTLERLPETEPRWSGKPAVCVVLASEGYPDKPRTGLVIQGLEQAEAMEQVTIDYAGVAIDAQDRPVTAGGRVLGVTALGDTLADAADRAYAAAELIDFPGKTLRRDIAAAPAT